MTLKSIIQDVRDGIGSISRRSSFDLKLPYHHHHHHHQQHQQQQQHHRSRSLSAVLDESQFRLALSQSQSCWAHMPPELLWDIVQRLESGESSWPERRNVVACAGVCRTWRQITKEIVKAVEQSGKLTFPISLKQPGPRDFAVQCFIKRDRTASTYRLYLGLSPTLGDPGKFLLAARKVRRPTSTDYIISLDTDDMSRGSNTYVGKLRSNFLGTKFTIYDSQPPHSGAIASTSRAGRRIGSKQVSPRVPAGSFSVAHIAYELNVLGTRGPRKMQCIAYSIPASALDPGGVAPTPSEFTTSLDCSLASLPSFGSKSTFSELGLGDTEDGMGGSSLFKDGPLVLKNKAPRWHEQLQCWCLNFRGRVTVASVKNFQLVAASAAAASTSDSVAAPTSSQNDHDKVILQFGKVGKDMFTMDYRFPLSAFQAFAICLSSFDTKLACE